MAATVLERGPVTATAEERLSIHDVDGLLQRRREQLRTTAVSADGSAGDGGGEAIFRLIAPNGEAAELPVVVMRLLHDIVHHLANDRVVSIVPMHKQLTTQQAADLLNVSRPHLIALLERGEIPYTRPGKHRRLKFSDVMEYKRRRDAAEEEALDELARLSQDLGVYR